jgi:phytoene dehydrogenase-like protein
MDCEVIVVGGGVGGLVTAALLAARGVDVCLFERQSRVGGCVASFEQLGYEFEPTAGLYSGWEAGGTWDRIFSELPVSPPTVSKLSPNFLVRLPNSADVEVRDQPEHFETSLASAFPKFADDAINFFHALDGISQHRPADSHDLAALLADLPREFRDFIDVQLQTFAQCTSSDCSLTLAAEVFSFARGPLWSIDGGAQVLADRLAESIKLSGGRIRLDAPVLRLAYTFDGTAIGIDLLSGERVNARRAIVSNLTIWDTYGKLVGMSRTPKTIATELKNLSAWGAYLLFLELKHPARLPASRMLVVCDRNYDEPYAPDSNQMVVNVGRESAPSRNWPVTVTTFTRAEDWFSFHENNSMLEEHDQRLLEAWWTRMHNSIPELRDSVEVIETATPHTFYETTRRKLGVIGRPSSREAAASNFARTHLANLFLIGDTVSPGIALEGIARAAYELANLLTHQNH